MRGLRWIAIGLTAYAVGQIIWDVQALTGYAGFPSPSDLFYLLLGPCVAAGLLSESFRLADRVQRKTLLLDAATLGIAATTLVLVLYLPRRGDMALLQLTVVVAYPASLLATACIGLVAAPTRRRGPDSLVAGESGPDFSGGLHPARRGNRAHTLHRKMGSGYGLRPVQGLGALAGLGRPAVRPGGRVLTEPASACCR